MATAPTQDFIVKSGLNVQGTSTVTSSTGNTSTLQVDGGAAIAKNLIVGSTATIYGDLQVYGNIPNLTITTGTFTDLTVSNLSTLNAVTAGVTTASYVNVNSRLAVGGLSELNNATLSNQTNSTSSTTGALQVSGGVGIRKDLWVGGNAYVNGSQVLTTASTDLSTFQTVTEKGSSTTVAISVLNTTSSTSTNSGALTVVGGVGIGGTLNVAGNTSFTSNVSVGGTNNTLTQLTVLGNTTTATASLGLFNSGQYGYSGGQIYLGDQTYITGIATWQTAPGIGAIYDNAIHGGSPGGLGLYTDNGSNRTLRMSIDSYGLVKILSTTTQAGASSTTTGALQVVGGAGIGENLYVGGALYVGTSSYINNSLIITTATVGLYAVKTILAGTDTAVNTSTGIVTVWNTSTLQSVTNRGSTTTNVIVITNTQSSTSTVVGNALQVSGGVGIDGSLFVDGPAYFLNSVLFAGTSTYVFSTNTYYTDNLINIHQPDIDPSVNWTVDDGKDVGHIFHYYKGQDLNAFLGLENVSGYLEWYNQGAELGGIFTGTSYGTFKTGAIILTSNTASISTTTGALTVVGGVGVGGTINAGNMFSGGSLVLTTSNVNSYVTAGVSSIVAGTDTAISSSTGAVTIWNNSTLQSVTGRGATTNVAISITNTASSTSTTTGAVTVTGGVGVGGSLYAGSIYDAGNRVVTNVAPSGSTYIGISNLISTGTSTSFTINNLGVTSLTGTTYLSVSTSTGNVTLTNLGVQTLTAGTDTAVSSSTGTVTVWNTSTLQTVTGRGASTNNAVGITNATSATSTLTGALIVTGGVGIGRDLYVGGTIYGTVSGNITTATNLAGGTSGQVPYQTAPGVTSFYGPGTAGQLLVSSGTNAPVYTNTSSIYVGRADVANTATTATNLTAGTAGQVPYQTAPGVTSFFGPGTAGNILVSNGTSAPSYNNTLTLSGSASATSTTTGALQVVGGVGVGGNLHVGGIIYGAILGTATTATNADNVKTVLSTSTSVFFPVFVDSNNATAGYEAVYSSSTFTIIPSSGNVGIGTSSPAYKLDVVGTGSIISATRADTNRADIIVTNTGGTVAFGINNAAGNWLSNGLGYYGYILGPSNASYGLQFGVGASNTAALTITPLGNVGIGFTAPNGKLDIAGDLYVGATQNTARFKSDNTNTFVDAIPGAGAVVIRAGGSVEKLRVTANGGISFGASGTAYGVSGQILQSNGDAAPTWISTGSLAAANATTATHLSGGVAGQIPYQTAPGVTAFLSTGTAGDVLVSNGSSAATYNNTLRLAGSTNATSTSSGALQVVGGVGVGGDLFIQGDIRTNDTLFNLINANATTVNFAGDATTLTMGASGSGTTNVRNNLTVSGNLTVQGTTTIVDSTVTNIADPIITLGGGTGNSAPTADDNKDRGVAFKYVSNAGTTSTGFFGYDDSTGYLTYVPTATITNEVVSGTKGAMDVNLAGGTAMSIHYQSAADTTAFLAAGSSGYLLQTNGTGSAPTWVSASGVSAGSATNADNIRTIAQTASASYYPTFVDSNNASNAYELVYTTSSFSINPSNGNIQIGTTGQDYQPSSGSSHTLRLNAANTSSIGFHDSGSTIGNLKFSGNYGFEIGAYDGLYGPHNTILHGSVGIGTQSPGAKLEVYVSRTASTNAIALLLNDNVTGSQTNGVYKAIRSASNSGSSVSEIRFLETDGTNNNTGIAFATANVSGGLTERVRIDFDGSVGIGTQSLGAKLHVSASQDNSILRKEVLRVERVGGAAALAGGGRTSEIAFADASNPTLTASIGGLREAPDGNFNGSLVFYTSITGGAVASAVTSLTERLRITSSGAIAFSGSTSYGSSGQVLQSNGNAAPTWVAQSTIAAGSAPLTNTYVGFGSGSNLLTGSANLTYASSVLNVAYQNTFDTSTPGFGTYGLHFNGQTTAGSATGITFSAGAASATNANAGIYSQGSGSYGTKMYFATTDSYAVGSKTRVMIDQAGNVGIGTVNPISKLQVGNNTFSGANGVYSNARLGLSVNGSLTSIVYASTYNDATYPDYGMVFVHGPTTSNYNVWSISPDGPAKGSGLGFIYGANADNIHVGAPKVYFQGSTGNVGIGTSSPAYKLETVAGDSGTGQMALANFRTGSSVAGYNAGLQIYATGSATAASRSVIAVWDADGANAGGGDYFVINKNGNNGATDILNYSNAAIRFGANYTGRATYDMTLDTSGNVGIGTTSTTNKFEVAGTAGQLFSVSDSFTGTIFSANDVSGIPSIEVIDTGLVKLAQYNGQVAINTGTVASSTASLSVYGMIYTMGTLGEIRASSEITAYYSSDRRLKENIKLIENPITIIDQIRGVTFDWTDEHMARRGGEDGYFVRKHDIGVIAQEVQAVLPELVGTREDGYLAVKYEKLVPLLIEAIKAQQKTIDSLVKDLDSVKEFINNFKNGI